MHRAARPSNFAELPDHGFSIVQSTTRTYFRENAKPLTVTVADADGKAIYKGYSTAKEFSTGSMGWSISDKTNIPWGPS